MPMTATRGSKRGNKRPTIDPRRAKRRLRQGLPASWSRKTLLNLEIKRERLSLDNGDLLFAEFTLGLVPGVDSQFDAYWHIVDGVGAILVGRGGKRMIKHPGHGAHETMDGAA